MTQLTGFILGSGWNKITEDLQDAKTDSYETVFGRKTTVPGHTGTVVRGTLANQNVICMSGRFHTYEGYTSYQSTELVRYLKEQGVTRLIVTSAVGGLNPSYAIGDLVVLSDMITLFCPSPFEKAQFQDLSQPFSPHLQDIARKTAKELGMPVQNGIYAYMKGPHYESFADKKALRLLGADVVGMSTVPEVMMANHLGMEVLGLSLVTNLAFVKHDHKEVLATVISKEDRLNEFFKSFLDKI